MNGDALLRWLTADHVEPGSSASAELFPVDPLNPLWSSIDPGSPLFAMEGDSVVIEMQVVGVGEADWPLSSTPNRTP